MKKQIIPGLVMLLMLFTAIVSANAQIKNNINGLKKDWITYSDSNEETILFDVSYLNPAGKKLSIQIFDEHNKNLFEGFFFDKNFHKTFCVPSGLANMLVFILRDAYGKVLVRSFKISSETKINVTVSFLNPDYNIISASALQLKSTRLSRKILF